jgi:hypothetical protein
MRLELISTLPIDKKQSSPSLKTDECGKDVRNRNAEGLCHAIDDPVVP